MEPTTVHREKLLQGVKMKKTVEVKNCFDFGLGLGEDICERRAGWQNLAAFRREQKWQ